MTKVKDFKSILCDKKDLLYTTLGIGVGVITTRFVSKLLAKKRDLNLESEEEQEELNILHLKEQLDQRIRKCSNVFITGHNGPDFDAIGSSIGLLTYATAIGKKAYIIVDDEPTKIEPGVKKIIDEHKDKFHIITRKEFEALHDEKSLLILTDVNKKNMISLENDLDKVGEIIIIDHHSENEYTVDTPHKFISTSSSSASEIVTQLLSLSKIKYDKEVANYLLAGISLDTHRFKQNTSSVTHDVAKKLIEQGANIDEINKLFLEEFDSYCKISNLILNGTTIKKVTDSVLAPIQVSFTLNKNAPNTIYLKEDLAKTADKMMKFQGVDASFAIGYVDEDKTVHVSARSGKRVNVAKIMNVLNGGGNNQSAGARIEKVEDLATVEQMILDNISIGIQDEEEMITPQVLKVKQLGKRIMPNVQMKDNKQ